MAKDLVRKIKLKGTSPVWPFMLKRHVALKRGSLTEA